MSAPHLQIAWKSNVDLYADLELHHTATHEDVKKSYKRLALKHHPDKQNPGQAIDTAPFMKVRDAYEILSNEESRRKYDLWDSYQYRGPPRETRQRGSTERRRRRRQEQYSQHRADTAFVRLETILERRRAENAAREHAEKFRQSEERSKSAIRRRQKEAERMARLRLQQQEQADAEQRHLDQVQTQYGARETFERSIDGDQRASARAPVDLDKTALNGEDTAGGQDTREVSSRENEQRSSHPANTQHTAQPQRQSEPVDRLPCGCTGGVARSGVNSCDFCAKPKPVAYHCVECKASACSICKKRFC